MKKEVWNILCIFLIVASLIFVSGQEGCPQQGTQLKSGIDYAPITGVSLLVPGKILEKNEQFKIGFHIDNYNAQEETGMICVRDDLADNFGGIPSEGDGDCQSFTVAASQVTSSQGQTSSQQAGEDNVYFPEQGQYAYQGLPELNKNYPGKLYVSMKYRQESQITGTVTSPDSVQPTLTQEEQPISVSVAKSIFIVGDNYQVNLEIHLISSQGTSTGTTTGTFIYNSDFTKKNEIYFTAELQPLTLQCTDVNSNPISGIIEFKNEKIIKCSAIIPSKTQQSYPLIITLDYGVSSDKEYAFEIKTK